MMISDVFALMDEGLGIRVLLNIIDESGVGLG